jgi:hypothetical protein
MDEFQRMKESVKPNYTFYRAVVEDNNDPEMLNRCKVRIVNIHTSDIKLMPTEALPWAELMFPTTRGSQSIPLPGQWVWVFLDQEHEDRPIIIGTITTIGAGKPDPTKGFRDPSGTYPKTIDENAPSTHRFSRVQELDKTVHKSINDTLSETDVTIGSGDSETHVKFKQSSSTNDKSKYPSVNVQETAGGHLYETDDTEGNKRIRQFHSTGTYWEIENAGTYTLKSKKNYEIYVDVNMITKVKGTSTVHITGNVTEVMDANEVTQVSGNQTKYVTGKETNTITGNFKETVKGNVNIDVKGKHTENVTGGIDINGNPKVKIHASSVFIDSMVYLG